MQRPQQQQLPQLPAAVVASILRHVPTHNRLARCALVCQQWASAAAAATAHLQGGDGTQALSVVGPKGCSNITSWLQQWGQQVLSIDLYYRRAGQQESYTAPGTCLLLPCNQMPRLQTLRLQNFAVSFDTRQSTRTVSTRSSRPPRSSQPPHPSTSTPAAQPGCFLPHLRELELCECWVRQDNFRQLHNLSSLTRLHLLQTDIRSRSGHPATADAYTASINALLQHLQGLQSLFLGQGVTLEDPQAALAPLSAMQRLQRLTLGPDACNRDVLALLPTSLTYLDLRGDEELEVTPGSLPQQLGCLQELNLSWLVLDPAVLPTRLPALTSLTLCDVVVEEEEEGGEESDSDSDGPLDGHTPALLDAIAQLPRLQDLMLSNMRLVLVKELHLFTALTAPPQLSALYIAEEGAAMPVPQGALLHMLPHDRQLPNLASLRLVDEPGRGWKSWCVDAADVRRMAACLPALHTLFLQDVVRDHAAVAELTRLQPALTSLCVGGDVFEDAGARLVARLTSLEQLQWVSTNITACGLQQLTALTRLGTLMVEDCPDMDERVLTSADGEPLEALELFNSEEAAAAGTADVWLQLQQLCDKVPSCKRARLRAEQEAAAAGSGKKPKGKNKGGSAAAAAKKRR